MFSCFLAGFCICRIAINLNQTDICIRELGIHLPRIVVMRLRFRIASGIVCVFRLRNLILIRPDMILFHPVYSAEQADHTDYGNQPGHNPFSFSLSHLRLQDIVVRIQPLQTGTDFFKAAEPFLRIVSHAFFDNICRSRRCFPLQLLSHVPNSLFGICIDPFRRIQGY